MLSICYFEFIWKFGPDGKEHEPGPTETDRDDLRQVSMDDSRVNQVFGVQIHWIQVLDVAGFGFWVACGLVIIVSSAKFSDFLFIDSAIYPFHGPINRTI